MRPLVFVLAAALPFLALPLDTASAAPPGLPSRALDIELKQAPVADLFGMLAEVSQHKVVLDPCVKGRVDLHLKNTPLPLVFDALALKLRLRYVEHDGAIQVQCLGPEEPAQAPDPRLDKRISVAEHAAPAREALARLAQAAGLAGVDFRASKAPPVTITVEKVRLGTVLAAIGEETGLRVSVEGDRLVAAGW